MMDPPSVAGWRAESVAKLEEDTEERDREAEEVVREIQGRTNLDYSTQTRNSNYVHFQRQPFQSTMTADQSTTVTPQDDGWIGQTAIQDKRTTAKATLPALKLEPFNGDHTRWSEFAAGFKALVYDVMDADYQRIRYLKMYLAPNVRSRISGLLSDPSTYQAALENLKNRYGNPLLIAQAATAKIARLPNIKVGDPRSLDQYIGGISDIITTLKHCNQVGEINSSFAASRSSSILSSYSNWLSSSLLMASSPSWSFAISSRSLSSFLHCS